MFDSEAPLLDFENGFKPVSLVILLVTTVILILCIWLIKKRWASSNYVVKGLFVGLLLGYFLLFITYNKLFETIGGNIHNLINSVTWPVLIPGLPIGRVIIHVFPMCNAVFTAGLFLLWGISIELIKKGKWIGGGLLFILPIFLGVCAFVFGIILGGLGY